MVARLSGVGSMFSGGNSVLAKASLIFSHVGLFSEGAQTSIRNTLCDLDAQGRLEFRPEPQVRVGN